MAKQWIDVKVKEPEEATRVIVNVLFKHHIYSSSFFGDARTDTWEDTMEGWYDGEKFEAELRDETEYFFTKEGDYTDRFVSTKNEIIYELKLTHWMPMPEPVGMKW